MPGIARATILALALLAPATIYVSAYIEDYSRTMVELCQASYCVKTVADNYELCPSCAHELKVTAVVDEQSILDGALALVGCDKTSADGNFFVAYRGSSNVKNWLDNLKFIKTAPYENNDIKVEWGFWNWYTALKEDVSTALTAAASDTDCVSSASANSLRVAITGHSAGGAAATLHAFDLLNGNDGTGGAFNLTSVYTYGSPRVGNEAFFAAHNALTEASNIPSFRVTHHRDIVPHVPMEKIGFHHVATETWYTKDSSSYAVCDGSGEDPTCSNTCAPLLCTSIPDHLEYLNIPMGPSQCRKRDY